LSATQIEREPVTGRSEGVVAGLGRDLFRFDSLGLRLHPSVDVLHVQLVEAETTHLRGFRAMRMRGLEPPQSYLHTDLNQAAPA